MPHAFWHSHFARSIALLAFRVNSAYVPATADVRAPGAMGSSTSGGSDDNDGGENNDANKRRKIMERAAEIGKVNLELSSRQSRVKNLGTDDEKALTNDPEERRKGDWPTVPPFPLVPPNPPHAPQLPISSSTKNQTGASKRPLVPTRYHDSHWCEPPPAPSLEYPPDNAVGRTLGGKTTFVHIPREHMCIYTYIYIYRLSLSLPLPLSLSLSLSLYIYIYIHIQLCILTCGRVGV